MKIGNVEIANKVVIAPMAGITNPAFRQICKNFIAGLVCTEMVSDKAICFENKKTLNMTDESNHLLATSNIVDSESLDIPSTVKINGFVDDYDIYTYMVSSDNYIKNTGPAHK